MELYIKFNNVKEIRDMDTNELKGYVADNMYIPLDPNNTHYQAIQKWIKEGNQPEPAFTEDERLATLKSRTLNSLNRLSDSLNVKAEHYIAGKPVSDLQVQRYKTKYEEALKAISTGDYSYFDLEAQLAGITAEELANLVKERGDAWQQEISNYIRIIEATRTKMTDILNEEVSNILELKLFKKYLDFYSKLTTLPTDDDIVSIITGFEDNLTKVRNGELTESDIDNLTITI